MKSLTYEDFRHLDILYKNRVILEMTLEDLEIWKEFDKIYPSYLRFPETVEWNTNSILNRDKTKKELEQIIRRINISIRGILGIIKIDPAKSSEFLKERKELLEIHLKKLREIRNKRSMLLKKEIA